MADQALINVINSLISEIKNQTGALSVSRSSIIDPGTGQPAGGKNVAQLMSDQVDAMKSLTETLQKTTRDSRDQLADHAKRLEMFGAVMAAVSPMIQQYAKYAFTRPYELLGGTAGAVSRGMLEREKDSGQIITSIAALLGTIVTGNPFVGGAIAGVGAAGLNQIVGRTFFQRESLQSGALQTIAQMSQERVPAFRDAAMMQYGLMKQDVAMLGMGLGGGRGTRMAQDLTSIGLTGQESTEVIARAIQAGGALGFRRLNTSGEAGKIISDIVNKGIYGTDPGAIAAALASGLRMGATREGLEAAARRMGSQLPEAQAAYALVRQATFLGGQGVTDRLFTQVTGTRMAKEMGAAASYQTMMQLASGTTSAAEGNEAAEMLLFKQFQNANPGASYMDFVEARRNKETDLRWLRTVRAAGTNFGAGGQQMRILGGSLMGTRPQYVAGAGRFMNDALVGTGELTTPAGAAGLAAGAQQMMRTDLDTALATATKFQAEYGETIKNTSTALSTAATKGADFTTMLKDMAKVMDTLVRHPLALRLENALRPGESTVVDPAPFTQPGA